MCKHCYILKALFSDYFFNVWVSNYNNNFRLGVHSSLIIKCIPIEYWFSFSAAFSRNASVALNEGCLYWHGRHESPPHDKELLTSLTAVLNSPPGAIPSCFVRCADILSNKRCSTPWSTPLCNIKNKEIEKWRIKQTLFDFCRVGKSTPPPPQTLPMSVNALYCLKTWFAKKIKTYWIGFTIYCFCPCYANNIRFGVCT